MNINEHTGKETRTGHSTKEYAEGWERIFGKRDDGCRVPKNCTFPNCGCDLTWKNDEQKTSNHP